MHPQSDDNITVSIIQAQSVVDNKIRSLGRYQSSPFFRAFRSIFDGSYNLLIRRWYRLSLSENADKLSELLLTDRNILQRLQVGTGTAAITDYSREFGSHSFFQVLLKAIKLVCNLPAVLSMSVSAILFSITDFLAKELLAARH